MNASNLLFALAVHRILDKVQSVPVGCQGLSLLGWGFMAYCWELKEKSCMCFTLAAKKPPSIRVRLLKVKWCVTADHLFFCAGISRALSCSYVSSPLPLVGSMSNASQTLHKTDSTCWPGRKLTWQNSELFAPGLMNWISSVKALMNISSMQEKGCVSMAGMGRRKGRAGAWDVLLLAVMNSESDSTLTCNFPRGLLVWDHETGTPFSGNCTIACHYHKQRVANVLKQEITVHTQDSQISSEAEQRTHDRCCCKSLSECKSKGCIRTSWWEDSVCVCEISNEHEGRFISSLPKVIIKVLSSQRRNTVSVEYDENVLISD